MALINCQDLHVNYAGRPLLDGVSVQIQRNERIGLVGRNGEGKSTLLSVLSGDLEPDAGEIIREAGTRVSLLEQQVPEGILGRTGDVIEAGTPI